jgi:predicted ATPase/DNA-binding XRE family transcriptional regulator
MLTEDAKNGGATLTPFGDLLKRHRLASGVSQELLAERAQLSSSAIGALERGARRAPYRETVALLASALSLCENDRVEFELAADRARGHHMRGRADGSPRHNLSERPTSFVGRDEEIEAIEALVGAHRLVTVTGSGGVGKTRTAVEVARSLLADGSEDIWFVDLSHVGPGVFVAGAVAAVLDVPLGETGDPATSLAIGLRTRRLLLVLDNCEHVIKDAAAVAASILRACPGVTILATSCERLAIEGESVYRLPSLPVTSALALFLDRAMAVESRLVLTAERLDAAGEICRQLEGIPLAIELAATRLPTLGFGALKNRLHERLVLAGGARDLPQRQRTMLATIAWSYDLLSPPERTLFRRLAIFRGGLTLDAAESVCAGDEIPSHCIAELLSLLVDKSLLTVTLAGEKPRYAMLESVRAFASNELNAAGEFVQAARAHAEWMASVADRASELYYKVSRKILLANFGAEIDNARDAIERTLESNRDEDALLAGRIVGGLRGLWTYTARRAECARWAESALKRVDATMHPWIAVGLLSAQIQSIDRTQVFAIAERALPIFERVGDRCGLVALHNCIAVEYGMRGAFEEAERSIAQAFALADEERVQRSPQYADLLQTRCMIRARAGRFDEARVDSTNATRLREAIGAEDLEVRFLWEGFFAFVDGDFRRSAELLEASAEHAQLQSTSPAGSLCDLTCARIALGEVAAAESAGRGALARARYEQLGIAWKAMGHLAAVAALCARPLVAAKLMGFTDAWGERNLRIRSYLELASYDVLVRALGHQLSDEELKRLAEEGVRLDYEAAVDLALSSS